MSSKLRVLSEGSKNFKEGLLYIKTTEALITTCRRFSWKIRRPLSFRGFVSIVFDQHMLVYIAISFVIVNTQHYLALRIPADSAFT